MNELELLDRIAQILDRAPKGFTVHPRADATDKVFAIELSNGKLFTVSVQEVKAQ